MEAGFTDSQTAAMLEMTDASQEELVTKAYLDAAFKDMELALKEMELPADCLVGWGDDGDGRFDSGVSEAVSVARSGSRPILPFTVATSVGRGFEAV